MCICRRCFVGTGHDLYVMHVQQALRPLMLTASHPVALAGVGHVVEYITEDGLLSVDLALRLPTPARAADAEPATHTSGDNSGTGSGCDRVETGAGGSNGSWARSTDSSGLVPLLPPPRLKGTRVPDDAADSPQLLSLLRLVAGDASAAASADERGEPPVDSWCLSDSDCAHLQPARMRRNTLSLA